MIATIKLRIKDKHATELNRQAAAVNYVWNYCNETQIKAVKSGRKWLSGFDLQKLTSGSSKELGLLAQTICQICSVYFESRLSHRKASLRWRGRKSLGWVPFKQGRHGVTILGAGRIKFNGHVFETMHWREVPGSPIVRAGSFNRDARGRWYINMPVEFPEADHAPNTRVGIDLGLKALATLSSGDPIEMPSFYRVSEAKLGTAQRARKTKRARTIHSKVRNRRKDYLHKASTKLAKEFGLIVVGDVSPSQLSQTRMAKSVNDASWSGFKRMLSYKSIRNGGSTLEASESMTTQTCSDCQTVGGPKGIAGLGIREWTCGGCGATHDRDVNAARNILARGLASLAEGAAQMRSSQPKPVHASLGHRINRGQPSRVYFPPSQGTNSP